MKNSKPFLGYGLLTGIAITLYALTYVGIKLECESLIKDKVITIQNYSSAQNEKLNLTAQFQYLNSEERIMAIAQNELGMIKCPPPILTLSVSREKIEQIQKEINSKYE
jgi:cell division protein FtsL